MRPIRSAPFHSICSLLLSTMLCLSAALALTGTLCSAALAKKPAAQAEPAPQGEPVEISGRIVAGLDKVFIKDAQGYCLVQGLDLTPFSGRHIQAKGLVIRQDQEYRTVRLLDYRIQSPDDESPGAGGAVKQPSGSGKKKK